MPTRGLVAVIAMARPRRPIEERTAVLAAIGVKGSAAQRTARLARDVASAAIAAVDIEPEDRVIAVLRELYPTPLHVLASDPAIDTASLILAERMKRLAARGGRRLPEREWQREDREIVAAVARVLARRYRRYLGREGDCCRKPD